MPQFKITFPDGSRKFLVTSENAETAVRDLKAHLASLEPPVSVAGEFLVLLIKKKPFVPPDKGMFAGYYEKIIAQYDALSAERSTLPPNSIH